MRWLQTVPGQLWLRQGVILILAVVVSLTGLFAYRFFTHVAKTIGKDAVPSIIAAQKIRTTLADAHTQVMNVFLAQEDTAGPSMRSYAHLMAQAHTHLLGAGENITFGDEERKPILAMMTQLGDYERLVGLGLSAKGYSEALGKADSLMRGVILPEALALDQANFAHLNAAFETEKAQSRSWLIGFCIASLLMVILLIETQVTLYRNFRRIVNPALALSLLVFAMAAVAFAVTAGHALGNIRSAKEDAFDSVHALSKAQALAYAANAHESVYLLLHGREGQAAQAELFQEAAAKMFGAKLPADGRLPGNLKTLKAQGYLADELANVTYEGEEKLATVELQLWLEYVRIDEQIRALEAGGKHEQAVALCLGTQAQQSNWAFDRFIAALGATLKLNQDQFDAAITRANGEVQCLGYLLLPLLLLPLLGSAIGLRNRLAEFRA